METNQSETMKRADFLRSLGLSTGALMAFYCIGTTMTSCSKGSDDPKPGSGTGTGTKVDLTLDLSTTTNSKLKTEGGFVIQDSVIVAKVKGGAFVALSKACTHEGTEIVYRLGETAFYCPNHGSRYNDQGGVINGPASRALKQYKTELSSDGTKLRVFES